MTNNKVYTFQWSTDMGIYHVTMYPDETIEAKRLADAPKKEPAKLESKSGNTTQPIAELSHKTEGDVEEVTLKRIKKFFSAWSRMMKEGCVEEEVYTYRRGIFEGVEGKNAPCPKLKLGSDKQTFFCGGCGCGERQHAALWVKGKKIGDDHSPRLWMPDPQCPIQAIRSGKGSGNLKVLGGRVREAARLGMAAAKELGRSKAKRETRDKIITDIGGHPPEAHRTVDIAKVE